MIMKQAIFIPAVLMTLTGCSAKLASIKVPENLTSQPPVKLTTDGKFWGLGMDGTFDLGGLYQGKYDRDASQSSYFGDFVTSAEGSMAAEITNNKTQKRWLINCYGGGSSVNVGNFSFGGNSPYKCSIKTPENKTAGSITIEKSAGLVDFGPSGKVAGDMTLGNKKLKIESIHNMEGSFIPVDHPLGYYLSVGGKTVAAIQINGRITLQSDGADMDAYAIATVASSLSIRPEED